MLSSTEIRKKFIEYFEKNGHIYKKPSLLVQDNDPTLMFTNAGMNQFKNIFLNKKSITDLRYVNSQVCLRVSGKHNDLDEVGVDNYHHTLFEMLGNWSMNDYFKEEAIKLSWNLLTEVYKLDKKKLYVTIFEGDKNDNIEKDNEAYSIWRQYVPEEHIVLGNKHDNFWEMGDIGPCGPCSEIHIDLRNDDEINKIHGKDLVNKDNPEVMEIWNIVFIQYERLKDGSLKKLDKHFIDTGMGFERLTRILQNKKSNYDTDIFYDYILKLEEISNKKYNSDSRIDIAFRVIVDHIRAIILTISEGLIPSNIKQGYVIRRILRRASRYGYSFLDLKKPFLYKFVDIVLDKFDFLKDNFTVNRDIVKDIIYSEEEGFLKTLTNGIKRLDNIINSSNSNEIEAKYIFELYDTYGFPVDLTNIILKEKGSYTFDFNKYQELMNEQKNRSKLDNKNNSNKNIEWVNIKEKCSNDDGFVGYDNYEYKSYIVKYRKNEDYYEVIFNETPFYGESGGQIGDIGEIIDENNNKIEVFDTKKINNEIIHYIKVLPNDLENDFLLKVNKERRDNISRYHSCTHILHSVLRNKFGENIRQMGSKVSDDKLRFDFNFNRNLTEDEIKDIENEINSKINSGLELIERRNVDINEAEKEGCIGLFKDKYGSKVRIIQFSDFSKELCCGTHVKNTKLIGNISVFKCKSISSGVKRIEITKI